MLTVFDEVAVVIPMDVDPSVILSLSYQFRIYFEFGQVINFWDH